MEKQAESNAEDTASLNKRLQSIRSLPKGQFSKYKQMFDSLMKISKSKSEKPKEQDHSCNTTLSTSSSLSSATSGATAKLDEPRQLTFDDDQFLLNIMNSLEQSGEKTTNGQHSSFLDMPLSDDEKSMHLKSSSKSGTDSTETDPSRKSAGSLTAVFYGVSDETNSMLNSLISGNEQIAEFFDKPSTLSKSKQPSDISNANLGGLYSSVCSSSVSSLTSSSKSSGSKKDWYRPVSLKRGGTDMGNAKNESNYLTLALC